jgi:hypothetical protein
MHSNHSLIHETDPSSPSIKPGQKTFFKYLYYDQESHLILAHSHFHAGHQGAWPKNSLLCCNSWPRVLMFGMYVNWAYMPNSDLLALPVWPPGGVTQTMPLLPYFLINLLYKLATIQQISYSQTCTFPKYSTVSSGIIIFLWVLTFWAVWLTKCFGWEFQ